MPNDSYLRWLASDTPTIWWHDSGHPVELARALEHGATGVTTNPVLTYAALSSCPTAYDLRDADAGAPSPEERAERLMGAVVTRVAREMLPYYERSGGAQGLVCGQVNPVRQADREAMALMARRYHAWAPNIAVKLPVTAAGLDVLEDCVAEGITVTATISFTVPQVLAVAERHRTGAARARAAGREPGQCFAVIMIGRLDDYIRDAAWDGGYAVEEADVRLAGLAVAKRAYALYLEKRYEAVLLVAALRGTHHLTELAGAELIMSVHPRYQQILLASDIPCEQRIQAQIPTTTVGRLCAIPEFVRAYEPDGMRPEEFISYGATQRTLSQFIEAGWLPIEAFQVPGVAP